jgi:hypothetical protein
MRQGGVIIGKWKMRKIRHLEILWLDENGREQGLGTGDSKSRDPSASLRAGCGDKGAGNRGGDEGLGRRVFSGGMGVFQH